MNKQLKMGIQVEKEHSGTVDFILNNCKKGCPKTEIFKKIAEDHLSEDKKYYTKLKKAKL